MYAVESPIQIKYPQEGLKRELFCKECAQEWQVGLLKGATELCLCGLASTGVLSGNCLVPGSPTTAASSFCANLPSTFDEHCFPQLG